MLPGGAKGEDESLKSSPPGGKLMQLPFSLSEIDKGSTPSVTGEVHALPCTGIYCPSEYIRTLSVLESCGDTGELQLDAFDHVGRTC